MTHVQTIATAAGQAEERIVKARVQEQKVAYSLYVKHQRARNQRLQRAMAGLSMIQALGRSPEVQSYIALVGPLTLWHISDDMRLSESFMLMGPTSLTIVDQTRTLAYGLDDSIIGAGEVIEDERIFLEFAYDTPDPFLLRFRLSKLLTTTFDFDVEEEAELWHRQQGMAPCTTEMLFQVLLDCAEAPKLEKYFLAALGSRRLAS